jgi:hypothetical protein
VYSRTGRLALALDPDPDSAVLKALRARLAAQGYGLVSSVPPATLAAWAAPDTPDTALKMARRLLEQMPNA